MRVLTTAVFVMLSLFVGGSIASADSTPIGPLPAGPHEVISTGVGSLVAIALPRRGSGLTWRIARPVDGRVVREVSEADVGTSIVIVFRAQGRGTTAIVVALTKGDSGTHAYAASTHLVHVR